jgi:hypothetical protein
MSRAESRPCETTLGKASHGPRPRRSSSPRRVGRAGRFSGRRSRIARASPGGREDRGRRARDRVRLAVRRTVGDLTSDLTGDLTSPSDKPQPGRQPVLEHEANEREEECLGGQYGPPMRGG